MSLDYEKKNIKKEFRDNVKSMIMDCRLDTKNILSRIKLFDYLVETQDLWKKHENYTFYTTVKYKLIEYKDSDIFPAYKYLKLLKLYCSYNTSNGDVCTKRPNYSCICESHKKFDKKLKLTITTNLFLLKDLRDIVIEYIR
jgi:hypothetical protein